MASRPPVRLITLAPSGETFPCDESQNVLAAMLRLGRRGVPSGCRGGGCGVCKVEVLEGDFDTLAMSAQHVSESERAAGMALACRLTPRSDLTLRVVGKMARAWPEREQTRQGPAAAIQNT